MTLIKEISDILKKNKNRERFLYKKSNFSDRLEEDVMENNVAYIPCKVSGLEDIISKFSVKGCESLNEELCQYIEGYVDYIPSEYPVVLDIYGLEFTPEEKKLITSTILSEMDYKLGNTEANIKYNRFMFFLMIIGTIISGILMTAAKKVWDDAPLEFSYVIFWLFADEIVRYFFINRYDLRESRIRMGRLASMQVEFLDPSEEEK